MLDINTFLANLIALHDSGGDPNKIMQAMYARTPQIRLLSEQYNNMTQGKSKSEIIMQLAKQSGVSNENIEGVTRILNIK